MWGTGSLDGGEGVGPSLGAQGHSVYKCRTQQQNSVFQASKHCNTGQTGLHLSSRLNHLHCLMKLEEGCYSEGTLWAKGEGGRKDRDSLSQHDLTWYLKKLARNSTWLSPIIQVVLELQLISLQPFEVTTNPQKMLTIRFQTSNGQTPSPPLPITWLHYRDSANSLQLWPFVVSCGHMTVIAMFSLKISIHFLFCPIENNGFA